MNKLRYESRYHNDNLNVGGCEGHQGLPGGPVALLAVIARQRSCCVLSHQRIAANQNLFYNGIRPYRLTARQRPARA